MLLQGCFQPPLAVTGCVALPGLCCRAGGGLSLSQCSPVQRELVGLMWPRVLLGGLGCSGRGWQGWRWWR